MVVVVVEAAFANSVGGGGEAVKMASSSWVGTVEQQTSFLEMLR